VPRNPWITPDNHPGVEYDPIKSCLKRQAPAAQFQVVRTSTRHIPLPNQMDTYTTSSKSHHGILSSCSEDCQDSNGTVLPFVSNMEKRRTRHAFRRHRFGSSILRRVRFPVLVTRKYNMALTNRVQIHGTSTFIGRDRKLRPYAPERAPGKSQTISPFSCRIT
jgi:hypothetical protein